MVPRHFDRYDGLCGFCRRPRRTYTKLPVQERLSNWLHRVTKNSAFMRETKKKTLCLLPKGLAADLGLPSPDVTLQEAYGIICLYASGHSDPEKAVCSSHAVFSCACLQSHK